MEFTVYERPDGMYRVIKAQDGGCDSFIVNLPTLESAEDFITRLLIMNGDLPNTMDMNRL